MHDYYRATLPDCQVRFSRHSANPEWAEGVQLALGAQLGYTLHKAYLRSCFIPIINKAKSSKLSRDAQDERRYRIFAAIKWVYEAPGIVRLVQAHLGWPTPNHLMTHYFRKFPHTSWWAKAHQYALAGARKYNIVYLMRCLAGIAARAEARKAEELVEKEKPPRDSAAYWLGKLFCGGTTTRWGEEAGAIPREIAGVPASA